MLVLGLKIEKGKGKKEQRENCILDGVKRKWTNLLGNSLKNSSLYLDRVIDENPETFDFA